MAFGGSLEGDFEAERRYRAAVRHSRRVRVLRRAIPVGAVLAVGAILFFAFFEPFKSLPENVSVGAITLNGTKVTMELPKLTGFKKDLRPYEVNARWAAQDVKKPNIIELKEISARIALQDRSYATVEALNGVYDSGADKLDLKDDVRVRTDTGYDVRMSSAQIEFKAGNVTSSDPVSVKFTGGTIKAQGLNMVDNGQRIVFNGRVQTKMKVVPDEEKPPSSGGATASPSPPAAPAKDVKP